MDWELELLKLLEKDCRMTAAQIAAMLDQEEAAVQEAIARFEQRKIVLGYNALVDWDRTTEELVTALIEVRVTPQLGDGFDRIARQISRFDEVDSLYLMSGSYDFCVIMSGRTLKEVASFVSAHLSPIEGVIGTTTHFLLKKYKEKSTVFDMVPTQEERMRFC